MSCRLGSSSVVAPEDSRTFRWRASGRTLLLSFSQPSCGVQAEVLSSRCAFPMGLSALGLACWCPEPSASVTFLGFFWVACISTQTLPHDFSIPSMLASHSKDSISCFLNHFMSFKVLTFSSWPHPAIYLLWCELDKELQKLSKERSQPLKTRAGHCPLLLPSRTPLVLVPIQLSPAGPFSLWATFIILPQSAERKTKHLKCLWKTQRKSSSNSLAFSWIMAVSGPPVHVPESIFIWSHCIHLFLGQDFILLRVV